MHVGSLSSAHSKTPPGGDLGASLLRIEGVGGEHAVMLVCARLPQTLPLLRSIRGSGSERGQARPHVAVPDDSPPAEPYALCA